MNKISLIILLFISLITISCTDSKVELRKEINAGIKDNLNSNFEGALVHFNNALSIDPNNAEAYLNLGNTYFNQQKYDLSMENANKAVELDNTFGQAYKLRAELYKKIFDDKDKACENYLLAEKYGVENLYNYTKFCK